MGCGAVPLYSLDSKWLIPPAMLVVVVVVVEDFRYSAPSLSLITRRVSRRSHQAAYLFIATPQSVEDHRAMVGRVHLEVSFITFHDDNHSAACLTSPSYDAGERPQFVLTTGGFPHEIVFATRASSAKVSKVRVVLDGAQDITLEKCSAEGNNVAFEVIGERMCVEGGGGGAEEDDAAVQSGGSRRRQVEVFELDPNAAGKDIRLLKLKILSGYKEFVAVYGMEVWGEESQQRLAVLESKAEVNM